MPAIATGLTKKTRKLLLIRRIVCHFTLSIVYQNFNGFITAAMTPSPAQTPTQNNHHQSTSPHSKYVVVGGGVAGVCCAEELCRLCPNDSVTLVSADTVLKVGAFLHILLPHRHIPAFFFFSIPLSRITPLTSFPLFSTGCQHCSTHH